MLHSSSLQVSLAKVYLCLLYCQKFAANTKDPLVKVSRSRPMIIKWCGAKILQFPVKDSKWFQHDLKTIKSCLQSKKNNHWKHQQSQDMYRKCRWSFWKGEKKQLKYGSIYTSYNGKTWFYVILFFFFLNL